MVNVTTFQFTFEWKKNFKNCLHLQEANKILKNNQIWILQESCKSATKSLKNTFAVVLKIIKTFENDSFAKISVLSSG